MNIYDVVKQNKVFLSRKTKNLINRLNPNNNYIFNLKDIIINGQRRGCSGFITNTVNNSTVYLTTEWCCAGHFMYRYVDHDKDFHGYGNQWDAKNDFERLGKCIIDALKLTPQEAGACRI